MNAYLNTQKTKRAWETPVMILCALMVVSSVIGLKDLIAEGDGTTIGMSILLTLAFAWGVVRYFQRTRDRNRARAIANTLDELPDEKLTFAKLEALMPQEKAAATIKHLLDKGYLQNMYIDWKLSMLHLTAPNRTPVDIVRIICPNCNAENMARKGWFTRCEYCDTVLSADETL